ncbi:MAG: DUF1295 domain-containing protein [Bacteroidetes bacterium]|nr:DUF1295 domain-containing protein [Bacteroidota bacterium]
MLSLSQFNILTWGWIALALLTFLLLLKVTAPYGRHTKSNWGPMIGNKTGWFIMELPALIVPFIFFFTGNIIPGMVPWVFIILFGLHYFNRVMVFPFRLRTGKKKMPVVIVAMAVFFNLVNGFIIGYFLGNFSGYYEISWLWDPRFITGFLLFFLGLYINWTSDNVLINLRKSPGNGYIIPEGRLFQYISCPNLFGEILEWTGFAILMWNLPGLSFAVWTMANLIPRALDHHKWYQEYFDDYPEERKAVIPLII